MKKTKEEMRDEVIALHPYKVPGKPETYDQYNQGWEDACYVMENFLEIYANQENAELKKENANLRRRLSDCERKRITGERI